MSWKDWFNEPSYVFFANNANDFAKIIDAIGRETDARARLKEAQAKLEAAQHFKDVREVHVHHHYGDQERTDTLTATPQFRTWTRRLIEHKG